MGPANDILRKMIKDVRELLRLAATLESHGQGGTKLAQNHDNDWDDQGRTPESIHGTGRAVRVALPSVSSLCLALPRNKITAIKPATSGKSGPDEAGLAMLALAAG